MLERFTDRARKVIQLATQEAHRLRHGYIGTEHLLLGLVKEGSGVAVNVLINLNVDIRQVRHEIEQIVESGEGATTMGNLPLTSRAKKVCEFAIEEAESLDHQFVGTEHLLLGLLREHEGVGAQVLGDLGVKLEQVREEVLVLLGHGVDLGVPAKPSHPRPAAPAHQDDLPDLPRQAREALRELDARLEECQRAKEAAVHAENFEQAACLKTEIETLRTRRGEITQTWSGRKTARVWEYEIVLLARSQGQAEAAAARVRGRLVEHFGGIHDLSPNIQGGWAGLTDTPTEAARHFRVLGADAGKAVLFFTQLREELRAAEPQCSLVLFSRELEQL